MPLDAILERRLLIISGKGGVGKTTVASALGILAARKGLKVVVAEVEGRGALAGLFNTRPLSQRPAELSPGLWGMSISPEESLKEYFEIQFGMKRLARPLVASQLVYYVTHAAPGLRDILMLGKVWYTATRERNFDLIVLDTPASGHAVSMLRSPDGFLQAVPVGPLARHTRQLAEFLKDSTQVAIYLVTLAEEMPVNETSETIEMMEERLGMDVSGVFVNMLYPPPAEDKGLLPRLDKLSGPEEIVEAAAAAGRELPPKTAEALFEGASFHRDRRKIQQRYRRILARRVQHTAPLVDIPFLFRETFGEKELSLIADAVEGRIT